MLGENLTRLDFGVLHTLHGLFWNSIKPKLVICYGSLLLFKDGCGLMDGIRHPLRTFSWSYRVYLARLLAVAFKMVWKEWKASSLARL